jgi:integrase/recombinase XerD
MSYYSKNEKKSRKLPEYMSLDEFKKIIKVTERKHHRLAFLLAFGSGMRISEIVNLQKQDVDFEKKRIFIRQGKGRRDRIVPLPKGFPKEYLKYIPLKIGIRSLQIAFKRALEKAGINNSKLHFHSLRHSFAVRCMDVGMPLNQIQLLLGHENIATTSIYLKINPSDALNKYEELW